MPMKPDNWAPVFGANLFEKVGARPLYFPVPYDIHSKSSGPSLEAQ